MRYFRFEQKEKRVGHVEEWFKDAHRIRTAIDKLCYVQDQAILYSMGLQGDTSLTDKIASDKSSYSECTSSLKANNTVILCHLTHLRSFTR